MVRHRRGSYPNVFCLFMGLQEGKSDMEFLREEELVNGLHVSSRSYKPITCYQISPKGKVWARMELNSSTLNLLLLSLRVCFVSPLEASLSSIFARN